MPFNEAGLFLVVQLLPFLGVFSTRSGPGLKIRPFSGYQSVIDRDFPPGFILSQRPIVAIEDPTPDRWNRV